jgi:hypothetical protein
VKKWDGSSRSLLKKTYLGSENMALTRKWLINDNAHRVTWQSGAVYNFAYQNWQNDPTPMIVFINGVFGVNPSSGHRWNLIQGINFSYIDRSLRKMFAEEWMKILKKERINAQFSWQRIMVNWPFLHDAIRRYLLLPEYLISNVVRVYPKDIKDALIGSWSKEFTLKNVKGYRPNTDRRLNLPGSGKIFREKGQI